MLGFGEKKEQGIVMEAEIKTFRLHAVVETEGTTKVVSAQNQGKLRKSLAEMGDHHLVAVFRGKQLAVTEKTTVAFK